MGRKKAKLLDPKHELGVMPDESELDRLIDYYPKMGHARRVGVLRKYFNGVDDIQELIETRLKAEGKLLNITGCSKGGLTTWVKSKTKRAVIKIKFMRYTLDEGHSRVEANQMLLQRYGTTKKDVDKAADGGQSALRKITESELLDEQLEKLKKKSI